MPTKRQDDPQGIEWPITPKEYEEFGRAYESGYEAGEGGKIKYFECPHPKMTHEWWAWRFGWRAGA
jgi:ribosome modulation factor